MIPRLTNKKDRVFTCARKAHKQHPLEQMKGKKDLCDLQKHMAGIMIAFSSEKVFINLLCMSLKFLGHKVNNNAWYLGKIMHGNFV